MLIPEETIRDGTYSPRSKIKDPDLVARIEESSKSEGSRPYDPANERMNPQLMRYQIIRKHLDNDIHTDDNVNRGRPYMQIDFPQQVMATGPDGEIINGNIKSIEDQRYASEQYNKANKEYIQYLTKIERFGRIA